MRGHEGRLPADRRQYITIMMQLATMVGSGSFLSQFSNRSVPDSSFFAPDFVLGVGVVIIQPSSSKVVLVTDHRGRWFLPKGRKDKGESLEQAALREAYEEVSQLIHLFFPL
jgi:NUDIX domain